jgi:2-keto-4-pentenoate hydratase/2-oxohepta-3-ene-1,7-dioic acid hydratase in catechol pathway
MAASEFQEPALAGVPLKMEVLMKLVTYRENDAHQLGLLGPGDRVARLSTLGFFYASMIELIEAGEAVLNRLRERSATVRWEDCLPLSALNLLAPIPQPRRNIFCVGRNYKLHIVEGSRAMGHGVVLPSIPEFFSKATETVVGHLADVESQSAFTEMLDYEIELGVIIGRRGKNIKVTDALDYVFGYTVINDISARDRQQSHGQWFKGKSYDTFCPMGPCIVTADGFGDPGNHRLSLQLNGELRQDASTSDLLFGVPELIASLSEGLTLLEGDVIATGTPAGVIMGMPEPRQFLKAGDKMIAAIEGIGEIVNTIK